MINKHYKAYMINISEVLMNDAYLNQINSDMEKQTVRDKQD